MHKLVRRDKKSKLSKVTGKIFKGSGCNLFLGFSRTIFFIRPFTDREIDSYSGFFDNGHRKSTGLTGYLYDKKISEVYLAGLAGDFCVFHTAMDSLNEKFTTFIIEDATRPLSPGNFKKVMQDFIAKGGKIIQSAEL